MLGCLIKDEPIFGVLSKITTKLSLVSGSKKDTMLESASGDMEVIEEADPSSYGFDELCDYVCDLSQQLEQSMNSAFDDVTIEDDTGEEIKFNNNDDETGEPHEIPSMVECGGIAVKTVKCKFNSSSLADMLLKGEDQVAKDEFGMCSR